MANGGEEQVGFDALVELLTVEEDLLENNVADFGEQDELLLGVLEPLEEDEFPPGVQPEEVLPLLADSHEDEALFFE